LYKRKTPFQPRKGAIYLRQTKHDIYGKNANKQLSRSTLLFLGVRPIPPPQKM